MKKIRRIALIIAFVLLITNIQTTNVWAEGNTKETAEELKLDTTYELVFPNDTTEYWYTITVGDEPVYYSITGTHDLGWSERVDLHIYDENEKRVWYQEVTKVIVGKIEDNIKLESGKKYYLCLESVQQGKLEVEVSFAFEKKDDVADVKEDAKICNSNTEYKDSICVPVVDVDWYTFTNEGHYVLYMLESNGAHINHKLYDGKEECIYDGAWEHYYYIAEPNETFYLEVSGGVSIEGEDNVYLVNWNDYEEFNGWDNLTTDTEDWDKYWYEGGRRQGTCDDPNGVLGEGTVRGREIYDKDSDGWYWLDAVYEGAKAVDKEVWMPYIYQNEAEWDAEEIAANAANSGDMAEQVIREINNKSGKWVRYDSDGKMYKGWYTVKGRDEKLYPEQAGNTYYYDEQTGLMAKGTVEIDGETYYFDEVTGVLQK